MQRNSLLGLVCLIAGLAALAHGSMTLVDGVASSGWESTAGQITSSEVIRTTGGTGTFRSSGYRPRITYRFTVDGTTYSDDRVSFSDDVAKTHEHAAEIAARYPVGAEVTVAFDADDPSSAVLEPGVAWATLAVPAFGVALAVVGLIFLSRSRRSGRT